MEYKHFTINYSEERIAYLKAVYYNGNSDLIVFFKDKDQPMWIKADENFASSWIAKQPDAIQHKYDVYLRFYVSEMSSFTAFGNSNLLNE